MIEGDEGFSNVPTASSSLYFCVLSIRDAEEKKKLKTDCPIGIKNNNAIYMIGQEKGGLIIR